MDKIIINSVEYERKTFYSKEEIPHLELPEGSIITNLKYTPDQPHAVTYWRIEYLEPVRSK